MARWLVVYVTLIAGCDELFGLDPIRLRDDAATGDGPRGDSGPDAFVCNPINHDEDNDQLDDACDPCPTFAGDTDGDTDMDGLPNECDRDDAASGDRLLAYWTFPSSAMTGYAINGAGVHTVTNNGVWLVDEDSEFTTTSGYIATRIDYHVSGISMPSGATSELAIRIGTQTMCSFTGANCGGGTGMCLRFGVATTAPWAQPSSAAVRFSLSYKAGIMRCEITDGVSPGSIGAAAPPINGSLGFTTNAVSSTMLKAVVIYGAKM